MTYRHPDHGPSVSHQSESGVGARAKARAAGTARIYANQVAEALALERVLA
jgi:hypothetical protein